MKKTIAATFAIATLLTGTFNIQAQPTESKEQRDARMAWWREARFGLFIHWGVYSVPAGYYKGKPISGFFSKLGEWIMYTGKIPMAEYQTFAKDFNPLKFDADVWVKTAHDAGMKYIVITSKHHDGFAMFPSKASPWNIHDATPFKRDPLRELATACRKYGLKLGFYYSHAQDWNNGGSVWGEVVPANLIPGRKWDKSQERSMDDYIDQVALPQVRELLTNYGDDTPAVIWWDTPFDINPERAGKFIKLVHQLKPDIIMNDRLGRGFKGDTETPENTIPPQGFPGRDWETCMTMSDSWGFRKNDNNWKSTETLLRNLIDLASKGGNYLLNVGPTAEGIIPEPSVERLKAIGAWMKVNGEAIYGTGPTPFGTEAGSFSATETDEKGKPLFTPAWVWRCTTKPRSTGSGQAGKLYLHLFAWPTTGKFEIPAVKEEITKAYLLADPQRAELKVTQTDSGVSIALPEKAPDPIASVVCVETK